jgi:transcriptional regulator with XRE-family HTH domain
MGGLSGKLRPDRIKTQRKATSTLREFSGMARTLTATPGVIERLREHRGLSVEQLSERAKRDPKTIHNANAGKPVYVTTMTNIAGALGVYLSELTKRNSVLHDVFELTLVTKIELPIQGGQKQLEEFLERLNALVKPFNRLSPYEIKRGSTIFRFKVSRADAARVAEHFLKENLSRPDVRIISIAIAQIPDEVDEPTERPSLPEDLCLVQVGQKEKPV